MRVAIALLLFTSLVSVAEDHAVIRLSEPVYATAEFEVFGAALPKGTPISLPTLIADYEQLAGQEVLIETQIVQVCQKKGCFFIARDGETVARVRFKDYGFFIPTDAAGKQVSLAGSIEQVELSPAQAAHYAEDLGQPAPPPAPVFEYQITASAVQIPLNPAPMRG